MHILLLFHERGLLSPLIPPFFREQTGHRLRHLGSDDFQCQIFKKVIPAIVVSRKDII